MKIHSLLILAVLASTTAIAQAQVSGVVSAWQTTTIKGVVFVTPKSATNYADKIDFAELERRYPVDRNQLKSWTQKDLAQLNQEQLDQLYARLTAGPIPEGPYRGDIIFRKEGGLQGIASQFAPGPLLATKFKLIEKFAEYMWRGKHFYRQEGVLRNLMRDGPIHRGIIRGIAWGLLGTKPNFDQLVKTKFGQQTFLEIFPAKIFCGQSLLDSRRESIVIDYAYGDTVSGYNSDLDFLVTREGLAVRDEVRMVRPGLYLGRAYLRQAFALVFTLSTLANDQTTSYDLSESCWTGTQANRVAGANGSSSSSAP